MGNLRGELQTDNWHESDIISATRWKDVGRWPKLVNNLKLYSPTSVIVGAFCKKLYVFLEEEKEIFNYQ